VLFDQFPGGKRVLGGAPFNVAWNLQAFGQNPLFVSRIGDDEEGETVRAAMLDWGMDDSGLQVDPQLPTGRVNVSFHSGEPEYEIIHPVAYDAIGMPRNLPRCCLLYHGSLALRDELSRGTLEGVREEFEGTLFVDVNLRPPWYEAEQVLGMVEAADWVKLNQHELETLSPDAADAWNFLDHHELEALVVTRGASGAEVLTASGQRVKIEPEGDVDVIDTVGAGDAFSAVTILGLLHAWPLEITLKRAQSFASAVVGQRGATVADRDFYRSFTDRWQND
jgi:fructokinase